MLGLHLDRRRGGTHYSDRMHRILGVCHACGILWHEEKVSYRPGASETQRVEDVRPAGDCLVTPQYEKYGLHVNPRVLTRLRGMAPQFAYALNVPSASVEVDGDVVYVRVPREGGDADGVALFEQAWALAPDLASHLLLGIDEEQRQMVVDMQAPNAAHCAVIGMTGSGKSTLMKTMILSAEMGGGSRVAVFDPSGGFYPLSGHPAVWRGGMFRHPEECERGLEVIARGVSRQAEGDAATYVFVDEVPELVRQKPRIKEHLGTLARMGRHAGGHLVLGAQHPLTSELGADTLRNIPVRLVGRVADKTAAYNATGRNDTGAEYLRGGGDFIAVNGSIKRHFQAAMPSAALLEQWARRYPPREPRIPPTPQRECHPTWPASQMVPAVVTSETASAERGGGRPFGEIKEDMIAWIRAVHEESKANPLPYLAPSLNAIAAQAKRRYPEGELWSRARAKVHRALALGSEADPGDHEALAYRREAVSG